MAMRWMAMGVLFGLAASLTGQVSIYGVDRNPSSFMDVVGKPELGHSVKLTWMFDELGAVSRVLVIGPDTEVEANVCHFSPVHEQDRWLLVAPFWHIPLWNFGPGNEFGVYIPEDASLVGVAIRAQVWIREDGSGPHPCTPLKASPAVRIQFMGH